MSKIAKDIPKNIPKNKEEKSGDKRNEEKNGDKRKENTKDLRREFVNIKDKSSENNTTKMLEPTKKREYTKIKQGVYGKKNKENFNEAENLEIEELKMRDTLRKNMENFSKSQIPQQSIHNTNNILNYRDTNNNNNYDYVYEDNYEQDENHEDENHEDVFNEDAFNEDQFYDENNDENNDDVNDDVNRRNVNRNNSINNRIINSNIQFRKEKREKSNDEEIEEIEEIEEEKRKKRVERILKDEEMNKNKRLDNEADINRKNVRIGEKKEKGQGGQELIKNDVNSEMLEIHKGYVKNLPYYYKEAITKYQSSFYLEFNELMRDGLDNRDKEHRSNYPAETELMDKLDNIIDKSPPINEILNVYRGINDRDIINSLALDGYINDMAYSSSSTNINIAKSFASSTCCLLKIIVDPKENVKYLFISKSDKNSEFEILFERGTHFVLENQSSYQGIDLYTCRIKKGIRRKVVVQEQQSILNYSDSIKNYFMDPDFITFELDHVSDPLSLFNSLRIGYPFADNIPPLIVKEILDYYEQYFNN